MQLPHDPPHSPHKPSQLSLNDIVEHQLRRNIVQIPLQFDYEPADIISKQLTKLHSKYEYRIVYLGPRWPQSLKVHRSLASSEQLPFVSNPEPYSCKELARYPLDLSRTIKSSLFTETLQHNEHYKTAIYYRAFQGMNPTIRKDSELVFDSMFESANLDCVVKVGQKEYDLFLRVDSNTRGHTLWYYFCVRNGPLRRKVTFNICNISKHHNLYEKGMKPYVYSKCKHTKTGQQWHQSPSTTNLTFTKSRLRYDFVYQRCKVRPFSKLTFQYDFEFQHDQVYFAYCVPYTYSYLLKELSQLPELDKNGHRILERGENGKSLMGLPLPVLKITDEREPVENKKVVVVTGRIHPGETNGSIVLAGLLRFLCSEEGAGLRRVAVFVVLPMMNPDGVVMGNYRTGAAGKDLNRVYTKINKQVYPEIYNIRAMLGRLQQLHQVYMFLDFHGHSDKKNTFVYGPVYSITQPQYYKSKVLPKLLSSKTPMFRFYSCIFRIAQSKKQTARAVMLERYRIPYTYTVESSNGFYYDSESKVTVEFNRERWMEMGRVFGDSLGEYIGMVEEYEEFVNARREVVSRRKAKRVVIGGGGGNVGGGGLTGMVVRGKLQQQYEEDVKQEEVAKPPPTTVFFLNMIEDIRNQERSRKNQDSEKDSDSDNDQEDLEPQKLAEFNKILVNDYRSSEATEHVRVVSKSKQPSFRSSKVNSKFEVKKRLSLDEAGIEMEILNTVIQRKPVSSLGRRRLHSPGKAEKRNYQAPNRGHKGKKERANIDLEIHNSLHDQPNQRITQQSLIDHARKTLSYIQKQPDSKFQPKLHEISKTQQMPPRPQSNSITRYSSSKFAKEQTQYLNNSLFKFSMQQNSIFTLPLHQRALMRDLPRKKSIKPSSEKPSAAGPSGPSQRHPSDWQRFKVDAPVNLKNGQLQFNFSKLLQSSTPQPTVFEEPRLRGYRSFKTVFPSSFYRIRQQQLRGRQCLVYESEDRNASLNIRRVGL